MDQTIVHRINTISIADKRLFLRPNCNGEKMKLKIRLRINGSTIINPISCPPASKNTLPNEIAIKIYNTVQTGQNTHAGGAHDGFFIVEYQFTQFHLVVFFFMCHKNIKNIFV